MAFGTFGASAGGGLLAGPQANRYMKQAASQYARQDAQGKIDAQLSDYQANPYLNAQMGNLQQQAVQNFGRNVLPAIQSNAIGSGGFGGSRQGIAEGIAAGDMMTGLANAQTNLLGQDYSQAMARNLQRYQGDQSYQLGKQQNANQAQSIANQMTLGQGQLALGNRTADQNFSLGQGQLGLGYAGLGNQRDIATMNNATQRYGIDQQTGLGYAGLSNARDIASMNNDTQRYGIDQNNSTQRYGIDANSNLGFAGLNNQFNIASMNNNTQRYGIDRTYDLGMTNAANNRYGIDQNYNLGVLNANNTRYGIDQNFALGSERNRNDFYSTQRGQDLTQLGIGTNFYGDLLRTAASGGAAPGSNNGFDWQRAVGGALAGQQLWKNFGLDF